MANNRLYIIDDKTGDKLCVAKSFGTYWSWRATDYELTEWLHGRDIDASCGNCSDTESTLRFITENES
jgi:hypothetical protein